MRIVTLIIISLLISSCSNKPGLKLIINEALGYKLSSSYQVIDQSRSPEFLDYFAKYKGNYVIKPNEADYLGLISNTQGRWKLQPSSIGNYKKWERIAHIKRYGLIAVSSFDSNSRIINIHVSE